MKRFFLFILLFSASTLLFNRVVASPGPGYKAIYYDNYKQALRYLKGSRVKQVLDPLGEWVPTMPEACNKGNAQIINLLIKRGADVNQIDRDKGNSCLQQYAGSLAMKILKYGKKLSALELETIRLIINKTKDINYAGDPYSLRKTALINASDSGAYPIIKMLLEHKAKIDLTDNKRKTALHTLTQGMVSNLSFVEKVNWENFYEAAKLFVKYKANLEAKDYYDNTPYDYLLKVDKKIIFSPNAADGLKIIEKMKELLKPKETLTIQERFYKAISNLDVAGLKEMVLSVEEGQRKSLVNSSEEKNGYMTGLHLVLGYAYDRYKHDEGLQIAEFLLQQGANLNAQDELGRTPIMLSFYLKLDKISTFLYALNPELEHYQKGGCAAGLNAFHFAAMNDNKLYQDMVKKGVPAAIYKGNKTVSGVWIGNFNQNAMKYLLKNKIVEMDWEFYDFVQESLKEAIKKYEEFKGDFAKQAPYSMRKYKLTDLKYYLESNYKAQYLEYKKEGRFRSAIGGSQVPVFADRNVKKSPLEAYNLFTESPKGSKKK